MKRTVLLAAVLFTLINSSLNAQYGFEDAIRRAQENKIKGKLSKMKFTYSLLITPSDTIKCRRTDQNELQKLISVGGELGSGGSYLSELEKDLEQCRLTVEERKVLNYTGSCESSLRMVKSRLSTLDVSDYEKELDFYKSIIGKPYVLGIRPSDYLNDGNNAFSRNNFTTAFSCYSGYLKTNPTDTAILKKRAFSGLKVLENDDAKNDSKYIDSTLSDYNILLATYGIKRYNLNIGIAHLYSGDFYEYTNPQKAVEHFNKSLEYITNYELEFGRNESSQACRQKAEEGLTKSTLNGKLLLSYQSLVKDVNNNIDKLHLSDQVKTDLLIQIKTLDRMLQKESKNEIFDQSYTVKDLMSEIQKILENISDNYLYPNISKESLNSFSDFVSRDQREDENAQREINERKRQEANEIQSKQNAASKQDASRIQRESLILKYGQKYGSLIADKKVAVGMTKEMCIAAWGKPSDINKTTTAYGVREQWVYNLKTYLYFDDDILTTIQN